MGERYKKLRRKLKGIELTEREECFLEWVAGWGHKETDTLISIIQKAREGERGTWQD